MLLVLLLTLNPLEIPHLQVDSEHVYKEQQVQIRCNTENGSHCHFYTDQSEVPFRSEKRRFKACLITVFGGELLEKRADQSRAEVFLSCAVELMMEGKNISSQRSEKIKIEVSDKFRRLQIHVDPARVTAEQKARIRCEADRGTRCHFYINQDTVSFRSEPYRFKVCVLSVSGRELLRERGRSPRAEVSVSCAVELETRSEAIISQRSEEISIKVEGLVESEDTTYVSDSDVSETEAGHFPPSLFWGAAAGLLLIMTAAVLTCFVKHKRGRPVREHRDQQHGNHSFESCLYSTITAAPQQPETHLQEDDNRVCYTTVIHTGSPRNSVLQMHDKAVYATVMKP
ncbi:uncharacterized protein LOC136758287 [Amia ocellicauda]|uniref:uncharacterized protein LOC136758287 n=1 Tax=Amia ocellicauda TaxID=2972642 RepID=UPI003464D4DB